MLELLVTAQIFIVEILLAFNWQLKMLSRSHFTPFSKDWLILDFYSYIILHIILFTNQITSSSYQLRVNSLWIN